MFALMLCTGLVVLGVVLWFIFGFLIPILKEQVKEEVKSDIPLDSLIEKSSRVAEETRAVKTALEKQEETIKQVKNNLNN